MISGNAAGIWLLHEFLHWMKMKIHTRSGVKPQRCTWVWSWSLAGPRSTSVTSSSRKGEWQEHKELQFSSRKLEAHIFRGSHHFFNAAVDDPPPDTPMNSALQPNAQNLTEFTLCWWVISRAFPFSSHFTATQSQIAGVTQPGLIPLGEFLRHFPSLELFKGSFKIKVTGCDSEIPASIQSSHPIDQDKWNIPGNVEDVGTWTWLFWTLCLQWHRDQWFLLNTRILPQWDEIKVQAAGCCRKECGQALFQGV